MVRCQLEEFMAKEIENLGLNTDSVNYIENIITSNIKAFIFANKPIENLTIYVVVRNLGEAILFKTVKGKLVKTKLDMGYTKSRELVGLEAWNVNKIFKLSFGCRGMVEYNTISLKQLKTVLDDVVEPHNIHYTMRLRYEDSDYHTLRIDRDLVAGLNYCDLMAVVRKAYMTALGLSEISGKLDIYLVDYNKSKEE